MRDSSNADRRTFLGAAAAAFAAGRLGFLGGTPRVRKDGGVLTSLDNANGWVNSAPLTAASLQGKVVLVSFWTYSCVNWLRTQPYLRAWAEKYRNRGFVVIGVHSPEFGFEKELTNVRWAAKALRVDYPIAVDSEHLIWNAFENQYWPALYFVDGKGNIRHHHFGEGEYDQSERAIQQLLASGDKHDGADQLVSVTGTGLEAAADWSTLKSPESYLGSQRSDNPVKGRLKHWDLSGAWEVNRESIGLTRKAGKISYRFHARDVNLVMGPARTGTRVPFTIRIDKAAPNDAHGLDTDAQGNGQIIEPRLYQLIRQRQPIADREFEIEFLEPGVEAFVFTFG